MTHKSAIIAGLALAGCAALLAAQKADPPPPTDAAPPKAKAPAATQPSADAIKAKGSYCLGLLFGRDLRKQKLALQTDRFLKGVQDGMAGAETKLTDEEITQAVAAFQEQVFRREAVENLRKSIAFLARVKKIKGIKTTASGLHYMVLRAGYGKRPRITDTVTVHYRASHVDGTVFDSSYARGKPEAVAVAEAIPGWAEGLQLMKEGAKWKFILPPKLAYGTDGQGDAVGPNCAVIIEVELINIK